MAVLSFALITAGDSFAALECSRRSVELNPERRLRRELLRVPLVTTGQTEEGLVQFQRALRLSPRDSPEWQFFDALSPGFSCAGGTPKASRLPAA